MKKIYNLDNRYNRYPLFPLTCDHELPGGRSEDEGNSWSTCEGRTSRILWSTPFPVPLSLHLLAVAWAVVKTSLCLTANQKPMPPLINGERMEQVEKDTDVRSSRCQLSTPQSHIGGFSFICLCEPMCDWCVDGAEGLTSGAASMSVFMCGTDRFHCDGLLVFAIALWNLWLNVTRKTLLVDQIVKGMVG